MLHREQAIILPGCCN